LAKKINEKLRREDVHPKLGRLLDYAYGYDDIFKLKSFNELATNFIRSAHKELEATVSLLLEDNPQSKAIETARMAVEMFLKAILIIEDSGMRIN
jgi:hypothetical protein